MKSKPNADMIARMNAALALGNQPKKPSTIPQTPVTVAQVQPSPSLVESDEEQPSTHPLAHRWAIKGIKLTASRLTWHVALTPPYVAIVRQAGSDLALTRHFIDIYNVPKLTDETKICDLTNEKPAHSFISSPFIFHDKASTLTAIQKILTVNF